MAALNFNRINSLTIKELLSLWRDKKTRIFLLTFPFLQLFVFAFAATLDVQNITIGFFDRDQGHLGFDLFERFQGSSVFHKVEIIDSEKDAENFINQMEGMMIVSLGERFTEELLSIGGNTSVQLILDGRKSNSAQIVAGYATAIIQQFGAEHQLDTPWVYNNSQIVTTNWFNPNLLYYWYTVPCLTGILVMLVCMVITSTSIARERELGTFDQLLVSPISPIEILIGKTLPAIIISLGEGSVIIAGGLLFFGIPFTGSILILWLSMVIFILSIAGIGLFVSSLCSTQQQGVLGSFTIVTPSVVLSGFATPIENMPSWLQPLTNIIPLKHYLYIAKGIFLKNLPLTDVLHAVYPLLIIAAVTLTCATLLFHSRLE